MDKLNDAFVSLFSINMGVGEGERIVVFSDTIRSDETLQSLELDQRSRLFQVAEAVAIFAIKTYKNTEFVTFPSTLASGVEPPENLWRAVFGKAIIDSLAAEGILSNLLAKKASLVELERAMMLVKANHAAVADVVIAMSNNSTSHTMFRALVNTAGGRFSSLPHFDPEMFFTSMHVDWRALAVRTANLVLAVNRAVWIEVTTPNGTHMRFGKEGRNAAADNGLLTSPGSFGNLPAGEVYLAPVEGSSEGTMVLEYAPTRKLVSPLRLTVREGIVVGVDGDEPHRQQLEQKFAENPKNCNIAELGIGTNDRATRPDNILEAEKILGTIHIAMGDNSGFGGTVSTPFHEDYIFYRPTLTALMADGGREVLIRDGALICRVDS